MNKGKNKTNLEVYMPDDEVRRAKSLLGKAICIPIIIPSAISETTMMSDDMLSQDEIDALLHGVDDVEEEEVSHTIGISLPGW